MEMVASQGKFMTLAPFRKSSARLTNKCREELCGSSVAVSTHLANICLCSAKAIVVQSFFLLSTWRKAALSASVLWGESSLGETMDRAGCLGLFLYLQHLSGLHQQIHTACITQTSPAPAQPFVNRHFDDSTQCQVVPNQYTQRRRLHRHR